MIVVCYLCCSTSIASCRVVDLASHFSSETNEVVLPSMCYFISGIGGIQYTLANI